MDINIQKEEFSYAYIYAVVSAAGYSFEKSSRPTDMAGIDISITNAVRDEKFYEPQLDLQVKSTSLDIQTSEVIRYPLKIKNYNELRKQKTVAPRILIVVLIPESPLNGLSKEKMNCVCDVALTGYIYVENLLLKILRVSPFTFLVQIYLQ